MAPRSPPVVRPPPEPGTTASTSGERRSLPAPTRCGAHGRGQTRKQASELGDLSSHSRPRPGGRAPSPGPAGPLASCALRPPPVEGESAVCLRVSASLALPPPSRSPAPSAPTSPRPPGHSFLLPSFLPPFPPSISLPSTGNSEAAPELASRRPALRPCPLGDRTRHLRPPLGAHSPAGALPLPSPPLPGTLSLRAPGDDSDLSSCCSSGRAPAPPRSGRRGGQPDGRGGGSLGLLPPGPALLPPAQTPWLFPGSAAEPVSGLGRQRGRVGSVEVLQTAGCLGHPQFPFPDFPVALEVQGFSGRPTSQPSTGSL